MRSLAQKLAENGFESRENYDYAVQCLLNNGSDNIRCLNVDGDPGRRKTAFAHALAQVLDFEQVLYFEFGVDKPAPQVIRIIEGEESIDEPPVQAFDRVMTEACALSEAEKTILIIDQLQLAKFKQHLRLYEFSSSKQWSYSDATFYANAANLLLFLISNEPLYHSLQQSSFKVWISSQEEPAGQFQPTELGLDDSCRQWLEPLNQLMTELNIAPPVSAYQKLAFDIEQYVRTAEQLRISIFGWIEGVDRIRLYSRSMQGSIAKVMEGIESRFRVQEEIELVGCNTSDSSL